MYKVFPTADGKWQIWYCPKPARPELHKDNFRAYPNSEPYSDVLYKNKADAQRVARYLTSKRGQEEEEIWRAMGETGPRSMLNERNKQYE